VLFLSPSESTGRHSQLFTPLHRKWKFYTVVRTPGASHMPISSGLLRAAATSDRRPDEEIGTARQISFAELARRALLHAYAPPSVVTDLQGNIVFVHGETGRYLSPPPGQATLNVIDMAHAGLQGELRMAIQHFASQDQPALSREASVRTNGGFHGVTFSIRALPGPAAGEGWLLLSFQETPGPAKQRRSKRKAASGAGDLGRVQELECDLAYTKENLHATIEEQQASNEELKSANEEMQSTNEELQSTNEELETSKEELQSVNEELITVNAELQAKIEQLAGMQNDMKNLFDNVSIGTIFLDQHLVIRRFTREAAGAYRLVATDVGRSLGDIKSDLEGEDLLRESQAVLDSLVPWEREVRGGGGVTYLARIRPYRTLDNVIDGVVLTFTDISARVEAERAVQQAQELAEGIVDTVREPLVVLNQALQVVSASRAFYRVFAAIPAETMGRRLYELGDHQWDIPALRELLENVLPRDSSFEGYPVEYDFPGVGKRRLLLNARRIVGKTADTQLILLVMEDAGK
jgi:two-component system CheB/CheR fusion protein